MLPFQQIRHVFCRSRPIRNVEITQQLGAVHKFRHARRGLFSTRIYPTPSPFVTLIFPRVSARHAVFTAVRLFSVYFGLASRSLFAVRDCVTLESFLRFTPPPSHA